MSGVAFRANSADVDIAALVGRLTGQTAVEIARPMRGEFDIRDHTDVMVLRYGEACFVCNHDIAWPLGADPAEEPLAAGAVRCAHRPGRSRFGACPWWGAGEDPVSRYFRLAPRS